MNALRLSETGFSRLVVLSACALLFAGCGGTLPSPPPTVAPAPMRSAAPSPIVAPSEPPLSSPAVVVEPTAQPPSGATGWLEAGGLGAGLNEPTLVPLADGGALVLASEWPEEGPSVPTSYRWTPADQWEPMEPLNKMRTRFGATLLQDGRVLVAGGLNDAEQSYSSSYVFDPDRPADGWSKVGLLGTARTAPSIATLPDGRVLVAGGFFYTGMTASVVPSGGLGARGGATPWELTPARRGPTDIDIPPYGYALATAEVFDPETGEWSPTGSMSFARAGAPAVTLSDGRVLIVGTSDDELERVAPDAYSTAEIYDPASGTFAITKSVPALDESQFRDLGVDLRDASMGHGSPGRLVALPDGGALLVGRHHWAKHHADTFESFRFDPATASWHATGTPCGGVNYNGPGKPHLTPMPCLIGNFVAPLADGRVLSAGRVGGELQTSPRSAAMYDAATDAWLEQPPLPGEYWTEGSVGLTDGSALVLGRTNDGPLIALRFVPGP